MLNLIQLLQMGETGCGKTFSIRYLSAFLQIDFRQLDVHGGITDADVVDFMVNNVLPLCQQTEGKQVWCFLDEINTCDSLALFKEMICDKSMQGFLLPPNLVILAACNPYRNKNDLMDEFSCGLQGPVSVAGGMNKLVYVVKDLPDTLYDYMWDYGTLNIKEEMRYITSMLRQSFDQEPRQQDLEPEPEPEAQPAASVSSVPERGRLQELNETDKTEFARLFAHTVTESHAFIRKANGGEVSVVSLRDVARCIKLFKWFLCTSADIRRVVNEDQAAAAEEEGKEWNPVDPAAMDDATEAMILAIAHCYHFRLGEHGEFSRKAFRGECDRK